MLLNSDLVTCLGQWTWAEMTKLLSSRRLKRFQSYHKLSWFLSSDLRTVMSFIKGLFQPLSWRRARSCVASAFSSLSRVSVLWPEIEVVSCQQECWTLATRRVVNDKALAFWLCRKELPQIWKEVKQVKCLLGGKKCMWIDSHGQFRETVVPSWYETLIRSNIFRVSSGQSSCFAWFWVHAWFISFLRYVCVCIS